METKTERIKAIVTIVVTAAVNIANVYGYAIDAEPIVTGILSILSIASVVWCWWKNQPITENAIKAQEYLNDLKRGE